MAWAKQDVPVDAIVCRVSVISRVICAIDCVGRVHSGYTLLEKFWQILRYVTDDTIGKLCVTYSLA